MAEHSRKGKRDAKGDLVPRPNSRRRRRDRHFAWMNEQRKKAGREAILRSFYDS